MKFGKPSMLGAATGSIAGLAAITPASGSVGPLGALAIGATSGFVCWWALAFFFFQRLLFNLLCNRLCFFSLCRFCILWFGFGSLFIPVEAVVSIVRHVANVAFCCDILFTGLCRVGTMRVLLLNACHHLDLFMRDFLFNKRNGFTRSLRFQRSKDLPDAI